MKHFKKSLTLLMLFTVIIGSRASAQDCFSFTSGLNPVLKPTGRAKEVMQNNEYTETGYEKGNFYCNPLLLNGEPLDYNDFSIESKGELTVIKGAAVTAQTIEVPFNVYLRRNGEKIVIPGKETSDAKQTKVEISEILKHAKPGDLLVIEPINKEDGRVKRILKILEGGC